MGKTYKYRFNKDEHIFSQSKKKKDDSMKGIELLNNPFLNKGTAFTNEERKQLGLEGLLPANVRTLEEQTEQCYEQFKAKQTDFEKRLF